MNPNIGLLYHRGESLKDLAETEERNKKGIFLKISPLFSNIEKLLAAAASTCATAACAATAASTTTRCITWGHGRGLSAWGLSRGFLLAPGKGEKRKREHKT